MAGVKSQTTRVADKAIDNAQRPSSLAVPTRHFPTTKPIIDSVATAKSKELSPMEAPTISDRAIISGRLSVARNNVPRPWETWHAGLDLTIQDRGKSYSMRVHFGDTGDGLNRVLKFDYMNGMQPVGSSYAVDTKKVQALIADLKNRDFVVGKYAGWSLLKAEGSNCGDAINEVIDKLGLKDSIGTEMSDWIKREHPGARFASERGNRSPTDSFFKGTK